jgi:hypothetical protein
VGRQKYIVATNTVTPSSKIGLPPTSSSSTVSSSDRQEKTQGELENGYGMWLNKELARLEQTYVEVAQKQKMLDKQNK